MRTLEGTRSLGRCRCRLEDNIKMDLKRISWVVVEWIPLCKERDQWWALPNTVMNTLVS
jgi:hypothetical protein